METPDQLRELFRMQKALNERIGVQTDGMSEEEKTKWLLNYCRAMSQELAELTDSVPWKWWAKYQTFDSFGTIFGYCGGCEAPNQLPAFISSLAEVWRSWPFLPAGS